MEFKDELRKYTERLENIKDTLQTEEATKMSLIVPFFQLLGYDVFNPLEFCPEYTADIGIKKGEKVDYAILMGKDPVILIEAKSVNKKLDRHSSQLFRYFVSTQDIPFLSSRAENAETEKKTEQQTIDEQDADTEKSTEDTQQDDGLNEGEQTDNEDTEEADEKQENPMEQAALMAVQYDYDGAIELLKSQPDYESNTDMQSAVADYENTKATCTEYPLEQITHVFFHTLIKDTARAFDGDSDSNGYNQYMTTIDEFNKIIQSMYDKGYVMVSPHDMAVINEDGTMSRGSIMLPPGKIPFVLSQDDVSYYHYMDGDGFASKLVVDSNGEVKNEYIEDDGSVSTGVQ